MAQQNEHNVDQFLATPVGRRAVLALGIRGVTGIYAALGACTALGLLSSLAACYRAPGTARDQLIFFSEEKEMEFGLGAYREVLRQATLSDNVE
ncbi:MAG: M48 family peptidase, partial [Nitrospirota bacterium]